ncbi:Acetylornithine/succinyldiaminopimelate aminotransferase [Buchnera aphidicola (Eriosoma grossulariae)]|uniref:acetylornithine/succinyldiaminopimelate transaminase n=1 Tax=Buchnera aphidicola TaxID=9 RepID=UPI003464486D
MKEKKKILNRQMFDDVMIPFYNPADFIPVLGQGSRLFDQLNKDYIDFSSGIAVTALGHCHAKLIKALKEQSNKLWHTSNLFVNEPSLNLARKLIDYSFESRVFFSNSGAEANESALKIARYYSNKKFNVYKNKIISFYNSFHGRTFFTVSVGGQYQYSDGFGTKPPDIIHVPYNNLQSVKSVIDDHTCAIIVEPIQGEGGVELATIDFMVGLRDLCNKHHVLLIIDEVQTGIGRTGKLFAYEHYGIKPDILTLAKALGGGFPIGATLASTKIAKIVQLGIHGTTYGGNPLACSVSNAVLDLINHPKLLLGVQRKFQIFKKELVKINKKLNLFSEIRGKGLLIGIVFRQEYIINIPIVIKTALKEGLIILKAGTNVIRLAPPLNIKNIDINEGLLRFYRTLRIVYGRSVKF